MKNSEFRNILSDEDIILSEKEIENIIDTEINKETPDGDLIEACIDSLGRMRQAEGKQKNYRKRKIKKILLIASCICVLMIGTLSAYAFNGGNIIESVVEFYDSFIRIRFDENKDSAGGYELSGYRLSKELEDKGISPVLLPEEFLTRKYKVTHLYYEITDDIIIAHISFEGKDTKGNMKISKLYDELNLPAMDFPGADNLQEFIKSGVNIYVFTQNEKSVIAYSDKDTIYEIELYADFDFALRAAKTVK